MSLLITEGTTTIDDRAFNVYIRGSALTSSFQIDGAGDSMYVGGGIDLPGSELAGKEVTQDGVSISVLEVISG